MVITAFDGSLYATVDDKIFSLKYIPRNEEYSKFVDFHEPLKEKRPIISVRSHPWYYDSLSKFMKNSKLRDIGLSFSKRPYVPDAAQTALNNYPLNFMTTTFCAI